MESDIGDAAGLSGGEIGAAGVAAIGGSLPRWRASAGDVAIEHRQEALGIGGIAALNNDIEDQAAFASRQVELVAVLDLTTASDDDVSVGLEQADQLLARRHRLAVEHSALALGDDARDQRQVVVDLSAPAFGGRPGNLGQLGSERLPFAAAGPGGGDQFAIEPALLVRPAAVLDCARPLLGQAPAGAPPDCRRLAKSGPGATDAS